MLISEPYNFYEEKIYLEQLEEYKKNHEYDIGGYCPINIGDILHNKYEIISYLGSGAYSTVYKVFNKENSEYYAIKITKSNKDDSNVAENELNILKKLKSNFVISIIDNFKYKSKNGKHICIVLNLLGQDLHSLKRQFKYGEELQNKENDYDNNTESSEVSESEDIRCLPLNLVKQITKNILEGLNEIHNKGFIHTDIKLENILLIKRLKKIKYNSDIKIKISDFGTAHHTKNKCEFGVGTLEYQAPESLLGLPYGKVLDVWSVGCIVFELITGYCLFDYTRYWIEGCDYSSASSYSSSDYDEEDDDEKYPVELTLLGMMRRILGGFPSKLFKKGKYYDLFFNYKGKLKHYPNYLQEDSLESIISECNYDDDNTNDICIFLRKMLSINPNLRSTTSELLKDNFLKPIKEI